MTVQELVQWHTTCRWCGLEITYRGVDPLSGEDHYRHDADDKRHCTRGLGHTAEAPRRVSAKG